MPLIANIIAVTSGLKPGKVKKCIGCQVHTIDEVVDTVFDVQSRVDELTIKVVADNWTSKLGSPKTDRSTISRSVLVQQPSDRRRAHPVSIGFCASLIYSQDCGPARDLPCRANSALKTRLQVGLPTRPLQGQDGSPELHHDQGPWRTLSRPGISQHHPSRQPLPVTL